MKLNYRFVLLIIATIVGLVFAIPSILQTPEGKKVTLGLDLQGGLHMVLGVKTEDAVDSQLKSIAAGIKHYAERNDLIIDALSVNEKGVSFELLDKDDATAIDEYFKTQKGLKILSEGEKYTLNLTPEAVEELKVKSVDQAIETIRNRLDQFGLAEPTVARQGVDKILVELPGIKTQQDEQRARELISRAAKLELMAVDEERSMRVQEMSAEEAQGYGDMILEDALQPNVKHLVNDIPILDGNMLTDAQVGYDQNNRPVINFSLNAEGAQVFGDFTGKSVGKRLAIVLDGKVYSAPVINERIGGGAGQISGNYTVEEANDLAIALRSGALLAPVYMMEKRSVGPSLGADSIKASMIALSSGAALVILFMIAYYGYAGVIATTAMVVNIILLIAIMAMFGATLTLPGMAGIVLTVGMAVDGNVIINERIRELLREGSSIRKAIDGGYDNAFSTLVDANLTTLIAAVALYAYGTGPIKGFAVTLAVGILVSMFTAIMGTHGIFHVLMSKIEKSKNTNRWFGIRLERKG